MKEYKLNIGEVVVSKEPASYNCLGLGSCIGLFVHDRVNNFTAGAHIFLPEQEGPTEDGKFFSVSQALEEILSRFQLYGSSLIGLRAKITGGACVLNVGVDTGVKNASSIVSRLVQNKIYIAAKDLGGTWCRSAKYNSLTGVMTVKIPQLNSCIDY